MADKKWRFREDMLGHYVNGVSNRTFQDAENRLNYFENLEEKLIAHTGMNFKDWLKHTTSMFD